MDDIYEIVRKENGNELHVSLISLLFYDSFVLTNGKSLYDHRAIYPLLSLFPYPLMVLLSLYLYKDELYLQKVYEKKYGLEDLEVNIIEPLDIIFLNQGFKGNSSSPLLSNIISSFKEGQMEECLFLLGIEDLDIEESPISVKVQTLLNHLCTNCNKEVINLVTNLINSNNKVESLSILLKDILKYKSKESYIYLTNKLIDKESNN